MITKDRRKNALLMTVILLFVTTGRPAPSSPSTVNRKTRDKPFKMKYEVGTRAIKRGARIRVRFEPNVIICEAKKGRTFAIPASAVTEVGYDTMPWSRSRAVLREGLSRTPNGPYLFPAYYMLGVLAVAGAVFPFEGRDHFVHIAWQENDGDGAVWFEVAKGRYSALLAELEAVTGQKPLDLTTERETKLRELQDKAERLDIILDREVWVAGKTLQPGHYDLVLLEITKNGVST